MTDRYASLKQGLVGCWIPSVSGSGLLLPDLSGRGNNGSLVGMDASNWVSASYGRALDFDGSDDVVSLPVFSTMPFSISCWALSRNVTTNQCIFSLGNSTTNDPLFVVSFRGDQIGDPIFAGMRGIDPTSNTAASFTGYVANRWYHICAVFYSASRRQVFVNGVSGIEDTTTHTVELLNTQSIGALRRTTNTAFLDGQVDDVRQYNRALTEPEIRLLASEPGIGFKRISSSAFATRYAYKPAKPRNYSVIRNRDPNYSTLRHGLVAAYCPSISGQGNVLPDLVGGNHGTLTNMTAEDWVSSGDGRALDFDGTNDYVTSTAYYDAGSLSFSFWAYFSGTPANYPMVLQWRRPSQANATQSMQVLFRPTGDVFGGSTPDSASGDRISFAINGATTATTHPFFAMTANTWQHWAGTYDGSNLRLFNSGVLRMTVAGSFANTAGAWNVDIANNRVSPSDGYLNGQLDDVRLYSRALSESEIKLLASKRGIGLEPRKPKITFTDLGVQKTYSVVRVKETDYATLRQGLVGAWCPSLPNGGSGNTLPDVSGYGNHGSLVGMGPEDWVSGQYGRALDFDGVNDRIEFGSSTLVPSGPFCVAWWERLASSPINSFFPQVTFRTSASSSFIVYRSNFSNYTNLAWKDTTASGASGVRATNASDPATILGQWRHFCVMGSDIKSNNASTFRAFENGQELTLTASGSFAGATFVNNLASDGLGTFSLTMLDDVRLYSRALTESEIKLLASRPGIGLRQDRDRNTFYQFPSGARRKRILTGMP